MWTNPIERGGLWHVNECIFTLFSILEDKIRRHLKLVLKSLNEEIKKIILQAIMKNEDLWFQWTLITANADAFIGMELLHHISELYLTLRGFAFASFCFELYKQCSKKPFKKSKSLCKKVTNTEDHCD